MTTKKRPTIVFLLSSFLLQSFAQQYITDSNVILNKTWLLTEIGGKSPIKSATNRPMSIHFEQQSNRVYGYAGCNNYSGQFAIVDDKLSLSMISTTRMHCPPTAEQERAFIAQLNNIHSFALRNDQLQLLDRNNTETLVFLLE